MTRALCLLLAACLLAQPVLAGYPVVQYGHTYHQPVHHAPKKVVYDANFFPVATFVPVPLFAVSSESLLKPVTRVPTAPAPPPPPAAPSAELSQVLSILKGLKANQDRQDQRITAIEAQLRSLLTPSPATVIPAQPQPQPEPAPKPADPFNPAAQPKTSSLSTPSHPGLAVLRSKCASCHDWSAPGRPEDAAVYFHAGVLTAKPRARQKMADAIRKGTMPTPESRLTLTTKEKADALSYLTQS